LFGSRVYQAPAERASVVALDRLQYLHSPVEHEFTCPYCGEEISMVLDLSVGRQTYIEDCEVCCKPIEISFAVEDDEVASFYAKTLG
jgi:transcription elongation factor Elf1